MNHRRRQPPNRRQSHNKPVEPSPQHIEPSPQHIEIIPSIPGLLPPFPTSLDFDLFLQAAYKTALSGGIFLDTKFYAFSRRKLSGEVDTPQAIYANSAILRASSPYFTSLLCGGFEEDRLFDLNTGFPSHKANFNAQYEYEEDGDLEDELDEGMSGETSQSQDGTTTIANPDSDLTTMELGSTVVSESVTQTSINEAPTTLEPNPRSPNRNSSQMGRVIVMPDVAFVTWRALIFYLGTGKISFAPLHSQGSGSTPTSDNSSDISSPPPCSPKSMYRLACQLGLENLKRVALDDIRTKMSSGNINHELFSAFTSS